MGNWIFDQIVDQYVDGAGKIRIRVLLSDGQEQRCEHLKFRAAPDPASLAGVIADLVDSLNRPVEAPTDPEQARLEIAALRAAKATLETEAKSLKDEIAKLKAK